MFDLSMSKILALAVLALIVFGPHELPKLAQQVGRALRDLRRIAEGAKADLREGLGPEFQNFEFEDLNPRRFVQRHLLDDLNAAAQPLYDEFSGTTTAANGSAVANGSMTTNGSAVANGQRPVLLDGAEPPFDMEAT